MKFNLSIAQRLTSTFIILILLVLVASGVGVLYSIALTRTVNATQSGVQRVEEVANLQFVWSEVASTVDNMLLTRQVSLIESSLQEKLDEFNSYLDSMQSGYRNAANPENAEIVNELALLGSELNRVVTDITELAQEKRWARAQALRHTELASFQRRFDTGVTHLTTNTQEEVNQVVAQAVRVQQLAQLIWVITTGVAVIFGFVASSLVIRSITRPVNILTDQARRVTKRDFSAVEPLEQQDEIGDLSRAFALMTDWLRESYQTLEDRVQERTRRLEVVATLSESFALTAELEDTLQQVVDEIQQNFGYYHAHIYLLNEQTNQLVVAAGTGPAGAEMKARGHGISARAASLVARAARTQEIVNESDVRSIPDWLPNRLLPDTRAEMAVPVIMDGVVVGVLDVQQNEVAGLDDADATLLRLVANQIAASIRNARLFSRVETALAEAHQAQARYTRQAWDRTKIVEQGGHYLYIQPESSHKAKAWEDVVEKVGAEAHAVTRPTVVSAPPGDDSPAQTLVAPVNLRDNKLGAIQLYAPNREWTADDLTVVQAVMDQLAQTAENLRLFDETRERAMLEKEIREITDKLRASPNLDFLLETAARELGVRLGVRHTVIEMGLNASASGPNNGNGAAKKL